MKIAFPTQSDQGMDSTVFGHFGSAPCFVLVDDASGAIESISNVDRQHIHGQCQPLAALGGKTVDAVVVGGIGGGALMKLLAAGINVYRAVEGTVNDNLDLIQSKRLPQFTMDMSCAGHHEGGGCAH
jgi:predicted Fe-Mo cluster-binding NifX family protein